jgi:hypothetical protein
MPAECELLFVRGSATLDNETGDAFFVGRPAFVDQLQGRLGRWRVGIDHLGFGSTPDVDPDLLTIPQTFADFVWSEADVELEFIGGC